MPPSGSERAPLVGQTRTLRDYEDDCLSEFSAYQSTRPSVANLRPGDRVEYKEYAVNFLFFKRFARLLYIGWDRLCTIIVCAMMAIALVGAYCQNDFLVALGGEVSTVTITALQTVAAMNEAGQCTVYKDVLRFDTCAEIFDVAKNNLWTGGSKECFGGFPDVCDNEVSRNTCFPPMQDGVVVPCLGPCDTAPTACWPTTVSRISDDLTTGQPSSRLPVGVWFLLWTILVPLGMSVAAMLGDVLIARLRRNVSVHMHKLVLEERRLYQLVTQETDIDNHDQRLTEDMEYCLLNGFGVCFGTRNQSSHLFYFLMLSVFGMRAAIRGVNNTGTAVVTWSFIAACAAVFILSYFVYIGTMNLISRILFNQKGYEGDFRWLHARIVEQCESICLYRGERKEHGVAAQKLRAVSKNFIRLSMFHSCLMGCTLFFDGLYAPLSFMFCFFAKVGTQDVLPFQSYVKNGIVYMTDLTRVFSGISVAAGACHRLATLIERLEEEPADLSPQRSTTVTADVRSSRPGSWRSLDMYSEAVDEIELPDVGSIGPQAETTDAPEIRFDAVTVYPPMSARPVFTDLSFSVTEGGSVCVVGPSGCGKSAVVRTLAGLWRQRYGTVTCPRQRGQHGVFFVPQRAYLTDGTLREQLTYPDSSDASDEAETQVLTDIIKDLELGRVLQMFGLDSPVAWSEVLSGGEAQRVCIARMLWHRPRFAVMDDSTSALDPELEVRVLLRLRRRRIGVLMTSGREPKSGTCERIIRLGSGQWSAEDTSEAAEVTVPESSPVVRDTAETIKSTAGSSRVDDKAKVVLFDALKDLAFFWKLTFPTLVCSNSLWLYLALTLHAVSAGLVISASRLSGEIINDLLAYNGGVSGGSVGSNFWLYLTLLWLNCLFVLVVSSAWCFCGMRLSLAMRVAVTEEMHRRYFRAGVPYAANVANPVADTIDQRMVQDQALAVEYLESFVFGGPGAGGALNVGTVGGTLQIVILTAYGMSLSWFTSLTVLLYLLLFIPIHLLCAIPIGKASVKLAQAEGRFRFSHARLREFVESVCMLAGEGMEAARLNRLMSDVVFWRKVRVGVYGILPVAAGWAQAFLNSGLPVSALSFAVVVAQEGAPTASSYAAAITFYTAFATTLTGFTGSIAGIGFLSGLLRRMGHLLTALDENTDYARGCAGAVQRSDSTLELRSVSLSTPVREGHGSRPLFADMSVVVQQGQSTLVMGPSGAGKSSLLRIIGQLWRPSAGTVHRPLHVGPGGFFFLPQRTYLTEGSLRDQVLFPAARRSDWPDESLVALLRKVQLADVVDRFGLSQAAPWAQRLSGGEMQKLGFVRLLCHKPRFAVLDEATSLLSEEAEAAAMALCAESGVTLVSVAHRATLRRWHSQAIVFDGNGGFSVIKLQ